MLYFTSLIHYLNHTYLVKNGSFNQRRNALLLKDWMDRDVIKIQIYIFDAMYQDNNYCFDDKHIIVDILNTFKFIFPFIIFSIFYTYKIKVYSLLKIQVN